MSENTYAAILAGLSAAFPPEVIQWKPGATTRDKTRALALAYVDSREYIKRLNDVACGGWSDHYETSTTGDRVIVVCSLTVAGVRRTGDGECELGDKNAVTSASAQAFKRACVKHGLGAYLYDIEKVWADYDEGRKRFTEAALADLENFARTGEIPPRRGHPQPAPKAPSQGGNGGGNGNGGNRDARAIVVNFGKHQGETLGQIAAGDPGYITWLAENWRWDRGRLAAEAIQAHLQKQPQAQPAAADGAPF